MRASTRFTSLDWLKKRLLPRLRSSDLTFLLLIHETSASRQTHQGLLWRKPTSLPLDWDGLAPTPTWLSNKTRQTIHLHPKCESQATSEPIQANSGRAVATVQRRKPNMQQANSHPSPALQALVRTRSRRGTNHQLQLKKTVSSDNNNKKAAPRGGCFLKASS